MWDCVLPTRLGRHGVAFSSEGNIKIRNKQYATSQGHIPVHDDLETSVSKNYSLGYLRHLAVTGEMLGMQLLSLHNLEFLILLTKKARNAIKKKSYSEFKTDFWNTYTTS